MSRPALLVLGALLAACPSGDDPAPEPEPTPAPEPGICDDVLAGDSVDCPAISCATVLSDRGDAQDGDYWLDGGLGYERALATCDMAGGGWLLVTLDDEDGILVAESSAGNPWHKCDDDSAAGYQHVASEEGVVADWSDGNTQWMADLRYTRPDGGEPYTARQLEALRAPLSELDPGTRLVATTADDDSGDWQEGTGGGHEVYIVRGDGDWTLLTPGTNGDCGGGTWPSAGSEGAIYLWATDDSDTEFWGDVGDVVRPGRLRPEDLLPPTAVLVVSTGGGVSFGFEERIARLR